MGGAGVVFTPKDLEFAAEWLGTLAYDDDVRDRVIAGQFARLRDFGDDRMAGAICRAEAGRETGDAALDRKAGLFEQAGHQLGAFELLHSQFGEMEDAVAD